MTAVAARQNDFLFRLQKFREDQLYTRQVRCRPHCALSLRSVAPPVAMRLEETLVDEHLVQALLHRFSLHVNDRSARFAH